jgi:DNA topoisomerase-1
VLAELGPHPTSGAPITVRTGRFGPYVSDGTVHATVPKTTDPAAVTLETAVELLAAREDKLRSQGKDPRAAKRRKPSPRRNVKKG